ncbi:hypothetical protein HMPREF9130_1771 [Peptoniphilus sp. oral taxon 375 str. F0436]|nr:hypothetical protein HMPREF9130_1771 [Peptoniphilus sp. oral taxon 375 str. F0436]
MKSLRPGLAFQGACICNLSPKNKNGQKINHFFHFYHHLFIYTQEKYL